MTVRKAELSHLSLGSWTNTGFCQVPIMQIDISPMPAAAAKVNPEVGDHRMPKTGGISDGQRGKGCTHSFVTLFPFPLHSFFSLITMVGKRDVVRE